MAKLSAHKIWLPDLTAADGSDVYEEVNLPFVPYTNATVFIILECAVADIPASITCDGNALTYLRGGAVTYAPFYHIFYHCPVTDAPGGAAIPIRVTNPTNLNPDIKLTAILVSSLNLDGGDSDFWETWQVEETGTAFNFWYGANYGDLLLQGATSSSSVHSALPATLFTKVSDLPHGGWPDPYYSLHAQNIRYPSYAFWGAVNSSPAGFPNPRYAWTFTAIADARYSQAAGFATASATAAGTIAIPPNLLVATATATVNATGLVPNFPVEGEVVATATAVALTKVPRATLPAVYTFSSRDFAVGADRNEEISVIVSVQEVLIPLGAILTDLPRGFMEPVDAGHKGYMIGGANEAISPHYYSTSSNIDRTMRSFTYATETLAPVSAALYGVARQALAQMGSEVSGYWMGGLYYTDGAWTESQVTDKMDFATEACYQSSITLENPDVNVTPISDTIAGYMTGQGFLPTKQIAKFPFTTESWYVTLEYYTIDGQGAVSVQGRYGYFYDDSSQVAQFDFYSETINGTLYRPTHLMTLNEDAVGHDTKKTYELDHLGETNIQISSIDFDTYASSVLSLLIGTREGTDVLTYIPPALPGDAVGTATVRANPAEYVLGTWTGQVVAVGTAQATATNNRPSAVARATAAIAAKPGTPYVDPSMAFIVGADYGYNKVALAYLESSDVFRHMWAGYGPAAGARYATECVHDNVRECGYVAGGRISARVDRIMKVDYNVENHLQITDTLETTAYDLVCPFDEDNGYLLGGHGATAPIYNARQLAYATETLTQLAAMPVGRNAASAFSSDTHGYPMFGGAQTGGGYTVVVDSDKFSFSTKTLTALAITIGATSTYEVAPTSCRVLDEGILSAGTEHMKMPFSTETFSLASATPYNSTDGTYMFALGDLVYVGAGGTLKRGPVGGPFTLASAETDDAGYACTFALDRGGVSTSMEALATIRIASQHQGNVEATATATCTAAGTKDIGAAAQVFCTATVNMVEDVSSILVLGEAELLAAATTNPTAIIIIPGVAVANAAAAVAAAPTREQFATATATATATCEPAGVRDFNALATLSGYATADPSVSLDKVSHAAMRGYATTSFTAYAARRSTCIMRGYAQTTTGETISRLGQIDVLGVATVSFLSNVTLHASASAPAFATVTIDTNIDATSAAVCEATASVSSAGSRERGVSAAASAAAEMVPFAKAELFAQASGIGFAFMWPRAKVDRSARVRSRVSSVTPQRSTTEVTPAKNITAVT